MECNVGCLAASEGEHFILYKLYQIKIRILDSKFVLYPSFLEYNLGLISSSAMKRNHVYLFKVFNTFIKIFNVKR